MAIGENYLLVFTIASFAAFVLVKTIQWIIGLFALPPGPWGVPVLGYLPFLKTDIHLQLTDMGKKYGRIFFLRLGCQKMVVLTDYKLIREIFRKEEFTYRSSSTFSDILEGYGIIHAQGALWKNQRKFLLEHFRRFGMTNTGNKKLKMESIIMKEVSDFISNLKSKNQDPINLDPILSIHISNIIDCIAMSTHFTYGDPKYDKMMANVDNGFKIASSIEAVVFFPILRFLPKFQTNLKLLKKNMDEMAEFITKIIEEHKKTYNSNETRDLIDIYLHEMNENDSKYFLKAGDFERQMRQIMADLFSAGMETMKTSLLWAVLVMLHNPKCYKNVQKELDYVIGRDRYPQLNDITHLPLTHATILEIMRVSSIVPLGAPHRPLRDTTIDGYTVTKETDIIPLLYSVHMDPQLWNQPEIFDPSRFIDSQGNVTKPEYFMPFGVGRRVCLGETLARMEFFLFFTAIAHTFDIQARDGEVPPPLYGKVGITMSPPEFHVLLQQRALKG